MEQFQGTAVSPILPNNVSSEKKLSFELYAICCCCCSSLTVPPGVVYTSTEEVAHPTHSLKWLLCSINGKTLLCTGLIFQHTLKIFIGRYFLP